jgi:hypothetical protein
MRMTFHDKPFGRSFTPADIDDVDIVERLAEQARQRNQDSAEKRAQLKASEGFADAAARRWGTSKDCGCTRDTKPMSSGERFAAAARAKWGE